MLTRINLVLVIALLLGGILAGCLGGSAPTPEVKARESLAGASGSITTSGPLRSKNVVVTDTLYANSALAQVAYVTTTLTANAGVYTSSLTTANLAATNLFTVTGAILGHSNANLKGGLVAGAAALTGTLTANAAVITGSLSAASATLAGTTASATLLGNTGLITDTLTVTGTIVGHSNANLKGGLVAGAAALTGTLTANAIVITDSVNAANATIVGTLAGATLLGNAGLITNTLTVTGTIIGHQDVNLSGGLVANTAALTGTLTANAAVITGTLTFEGTTDDENETTVTVTDPTTDRVVTFQNATGTVALTSQAVDMTLTADATGGNAGAKNEYIGLPRIKLIGGAQGTNPGGQTIAMFDDTPDDEWAPGDATVTESADTTYYKYGSKSYKAAFGADAVAVSSGFTDTNLFAGAALDDMESCGLLLYTTAAIASGDLALVLTDDGGERSFVIPAVPAANVWTWVEVNIATGDLSAVSDAAIVLTAQGEAALGAFDLYVDIGYVWDVTDEEALGVALQQDGILGVINTETGAGLAELTDYLVHYESGNDFIVYISDQSTADIAILAAY